jgi:coproporphyrinogen III oxidase
VTRESGQFKEQISRRFSDLQNTICAGLERADGAGRFKEDLWQHGAGGGGKTHVLQSGTIFEKGGVNFSAVQSRLSPKLAHRLQVEEQETFATGLSLVIHPANPFVPTVHLNVRYFELENGDSWFGGGTDLTPWYLFEEDAVHFHRTLKTACDRNDPAYYSKFKKNCDEYFYLPHRNETRGIGGVFFDYLRGKPDETFAFVSDIGDAFLNAYLPIVERRKGIPWNEQQREWQLVRRGRYVEFNLLYDRGTLFGLETGGRTESILMSLPPEVKWKYDYSPAPGTPEAKLVDVLQHPKDWV